MAHKYINENSPKSRIRRKFYQVRLEDLQEYFNYHIFYFDEDYPHEDYDEALIRKYEEQTLIFIRSIGAMLNVDAFLTIGNEMVYVRRLPPGITSIQEEL
jgi:hypothetical protein